MIVALKVLSKKQFALSRFQLEIESACPMPSAAQTDRVRILHEICPSSFRARFQRPTSFSLGSNMWTKFGTPSSKLWRLFKEPNPMQRAGRTENADFTFADSIPMSFQCDVKSTISLELKPVREIRLRSCRTSGLRAMCHSGRGCLPAAGHHECALVHPR